MKVNIQTTQYEVVETGCMIVPYGESVDFNIEDLTFRLQFRTQDGGASTFGLDVQKELGRDIMVIYANNFNDSILKTSKGLLNVAKIEGRPLGVRFSITSVNRREIGEEGSKQTVEDMLVYYTWFLQKLTSPTGQSASSM